MQFFNKNRDLAIETLEEIVSETGIEKFICVGYILQNAFSQNQEGFTQIFEELMFFNQKEVISQNDLLEG